MGDGGAQAAPAFDGDAGVPVAVNDQNGHLKFGEAGFQGIADVQVGLLGGGDGVQAGQVCGGDTGETVGVVGFQVGEPLRDGAGHGGRPALGGDAVFETAQFLPAHFPLGFLGVGHGVDQYQGIGHLRAIQGELHGDGAAGGGAEDVGFGDVQAFQQRPQVPGAVGDVVAVGRGRGQAAGAPVVEYAAVFCRQGGRLAVDGIPAAVAAAEAAVDQRQGGGVRGAKDSVVHPVAVDVVKRHRFNSR